jgi:membrane protein implicated in regulation of membrane protease activity
MERLWGRRLRLITLVTGLLLLFCLAGLLLWSLWSLLMALPDLFYWALLVTAVAIAALFILMGRERRAGRAQGTGLEVSQRQNLGRVHELLRQISWAGQGGLFQDKLRLELRRLARQLIAIRRGISEERALPGGLHRQ